MTEGTTIRSDLRPTQLPWLRWISIAIGVGLLSLVLLFPFSHTGRHWSELFNLAHAVSFFLVFVAAAAMLDPSSVGLPVSLSPIVRMGWSRLLGLASLLLVLGSLCEVLQQFVGRSTSLTDVLANGSGLIAGLFWCLSRLPAARSHQRTSMAMTAGLLILPSWSPVLELIECTHQHRDFPLLASFERPRELNAWKAHESEIERSMTWSAHGSYSMKVQGIAGTRFPGANFLEPIPDWHGHTALELDVFNPGDKTLTLRISISDSQHHANSHKLSDRFGRSVELVPGETTRIHIDLDEIRHAPANREMLLDQIESLNLFIVGPDTDFVFLVDNVRLNDNASK